MAEAEIMSKVIASVFDYVTRQARPLVGTWKKRLFGSLYLKWESNTSFYNIFFGQMKLRVPLTALLGCDDFGRVYMSK